MPSDDAALQRRQQLAAKYAHLPLLADRPQRCPYMGRALLTSAEFNRGSGFTQEERREFDLEGLVPTAVQTLEEQAARAYEQYRSRPDALARNTFMTSMMEQSQVLYFRLVQDHLREMMSVIYTPTEGDAIQNYSRLFRRSDGCFLDIEQAASEREIEERLRRQGKGVDDVDYIVVSDGEEILGIGDQGVGGVLISIAKLILTTACAGIHPGRTIPVVLDCGTDNAQLRDDELYLGLRQPRVRGARYDAFVDNFVKVVGRLFPRAYLHFEDFGLANARRILDRYRPEIACFNDDVQGTGCVTLAAMQAALKIAGLSLSQVRVVVFGAGTAGTGIADMIRDAIASEGSKTKEDAARQIWCVDKAGLLLQSMGDRLTHGQAGYARADSEIQGDMSSLLDVVRHVQPHVLIGTSTKPKSFTEEVVREMTRHAPRPIIFPLSNPTRLHEAHPHDLLRWTGGAALVSTGSPFPPWEVDDDGSGCRRRVEIAECNNSTCFPGIGLGAVLCRAARCSDRMLVEATKALAAQSPALRGDEPDGDRGLLPDVVDAREVSVQIAKAVIRTAQAEGLAREEGIPGGGGGGDDEDDSELDEWVRVQMWEPVYRELVKV